MKGKAILIFISLLIADRLTKIFYGRIDFCNAVLCIKPATNTGAAFGILQGLNWLFIAIGLFVLALIFFTLKKCKITYLKIALILTLSGTTSNLIDRIFYGYVQDFIAFGFVNFPSFNLADTFNFIGAIMLIVILISKNNLK